MNSSTENGFYVCEILLKFLVTAHIYEKISHDYA